MGGKSTTSTQQVQIPPDVLAQYNNVNAQAQTAAATPFQQYSTNPSSFVAPLTGTQDAGIQNTNAAHDIGAGYYSAATGQLGAAQDSTTPYYSAAGQDITGAQGLGSALGATSYGTLQAANQSASPLQDAASSAYTGAYGSAQPLDIASLLSYLNGSSAAAPLQGAAANDITGAQGVGTGLGLSALGQSQNSYAAAQPYNTAALSQYLTGLGAAQPLQTAAAQNISGAQGAGAQLLMGSLGTLGGASAMANPLNYGALGAAQSAGAGALGAAGGAGSGASAAAGGAGEANQAVGQAQQAFQTGIGAANPLQTTAGQGFASALTGAQPFQNLATNYAVQGGAAVNPTTLDAASINQYMNPYLNQVLGSTAGLLNQNNQQQMSGELGNIISQGAFGGDRGGIAAANLEQQQNLANANIYSGISSNAFNAALGAAQQQQGVALGAGQANRAALQQASTQLQGIGQQGFSQATTTAQQQQALAQQLYNQYAGMGSTVGGLGVQAGGVGVQAGGVGVQAAGVGVQGQAVAEQAANTQAQIANQVYQQGLASAQQQANIGSALFGQGLSTAQAQGALGQQIFGQYGTTGQAVGALGQQGFAQGQTAAGQTANIGQNLSQLGLAAGAQSAGLGQQVYGQNQTTGQNLAALGQQNYTQGMGLGTAQQGLASQLFGQGATTAQQQAALSQLLFGQGTTAAGAQQGLGQAVYGTGANTANQLAALGSGAQSTALQGAQAQLAAGQVDQQTQQAGLTALYNQFLQQQSYPFQVDQFLANIAEGTGALSGSTTTTTQPGGFFSDKRLKEDIEPVGQTFDGQNIVRFRYKGDPRKQIGLVAQDVEKRHPDAVGLASGYKTVDYGKATDRAAARGHFAEGGLARAAYAYGGYPDLPGMYPADIGALLQSQAQMYAPYAGNGGLYGGGQGSAPRGGSSYVPQGNLPVSHLAVAGGLAPQSNQADRIRQIAGIADEASKVGDWASKTFSKLGAPSNDTDIMNADAALFAARGGRMGYDSGGAVPDAGGALPYAGQESMGIDIPEQTPTHELTLPNSPLKQGESGLGQVADAAKAAAGIGTAIAHILPLLALARGGRAGYDSGGSAANDDSTQNSDPWSIAQAALMGGALGPAGALGGLGLWAGEHAQDVMHGVGNILSPPGSAQNTLGLAGGLAARALAAPSPHLPDSAIAAPAPAVVPHHHSSGLGTANSSSAPTPAPAPSLGPISLPTPQTAGQGAPMLSAPPTTQVDTANPAPDLGAIKPPTSRDISAALGDQPRSQDSNPLQAVGHGIEGAMAKIPATLRNDPSILPAILAGIAAMGTAPTRSFGVALAAGVGAGTQAYMGRQNQLAALGQTRAQTQLTQSEAFRGMQTPSGIPVPGMENAVMTLPGKGPDPSKAFQDSNGRWWHQVLKAGMLNINNAPPAGIAAQPGAPTPAASPAAAMDAPVLAAPAKGPISTDYKSGSYNIAPSPAADAYVASTLKVDPSQLGVANFAKLAATNPNLAAMEPSAKASADTRIGNQQDIENTHKQLLQLGTAINALPQSGVTTGGKGFDYRMGLLNIAKTAGQMLGLPSDPTLTSQLADQQIINKIKGLQGAAMAHQDDMRAASVANMLTSVLPGGEQQLPASNHILASMLVQNQNLRDFPSYRNAYVSKYGTNIGVEQAFQRDMGPVYDKEMQNIPQMLTRGSGKQSPAEAAMAHPDKIQTFEQGFKLPNGSAVPGFGDGSSRYWR